MLSPSVNAKASDETCWENVSDEFPHAVQLWLQRRESTVIYPNNPTLGSMVGDVPWLFSDTLTRLRKLLSVAICGVC